ncbi:unnamed protein product, partial [Rotaria sp. Silwood2]
MLHGFLVIYEVICGIIRVGIFFASMNNQAYNNDKYPFDNRTMVTTTTSLPEFRKVPQI